MPTTTPNAAGRFGSSVATPHVITVGSTECVVRVTHLCPIADVLGFEPEMVTTGPVDAGTLADLLDSRMIAPPRPRRRRDRAISSRALFYAAE